MTVWAKKIPATRGEPDRGEVIQKDNYENDIIIAPF